MKTLGEKPRKQTTEEPTYNFRSAGLIEFYAEFTDLVKSLYSLVKFLDPKYDYHHPIVEGISARKDLQKLNYPEQSLLRQSTSTCTQHLQQLLSFCFLVIDAKDKVIEGEIPEGCLDAIFNNFYKLTGACEGYASQYLGFVETIKKQIRDKHCLLLADDFHDFPFQILDYFEKILGSLHLITRILSSANQQLYERRYEVSRLQGEVRERIIQNKLRNTQLKVLRPELVIEKKAEQGLQQVIALVEKLRPFRSYQNQHKRGWFFRRGRDKLYFFNEQGICFSLDCTPNESSLKLKLESHCLGSQLEKACQDMAFLVEFLRGNGVVVADAEESFCRLFSSRYIYVLKNAERALTILDKFFQERVKNFADFNAELFIKCFDDALRRFQQIQVLLKKGDSVYLPKDVKQFYDDRHQELNRYYAVYLIYTILQLADEEIERCNKLGLHKAHCLVSNLNTADKFLRSLEKQDKSSTLIISLRDKYNSLDKNRPAQVISYKGDGRPDVYPVFVDEADELKLRGELGSSLVIQRVDLEEHNVTNVGSRSPSNQSVGMRTPTRGQEVTLSDVPKTTRRTNVGNQTAFLAEGEASVAETPPRARSQLDGQITNIDSTPISETQEGGDVPLSPSRRQTSRQAITDASNIINTIGLILNEPNKFLISFIAALSRELPAEEGQWRVFIAANVKKIVREKNGKKEYLTIEEQDLLIHRILTFYKIDKTRQQADSLCINPFKPLAIRIQMQPQTEAALAPTTQAPQQENLDDLLKQLQGNLLISVFDNVALNHENKLMQVEQVEEVLENKQKNDVSASANWKTWRKYLKRGARRWWFSKHLPKPQKDSEDFFQQSIASIVERAEKKSNKEVRRLFRSYWRKLREIEQQQKAIQDLCKLNTPSLLQRMTVLIKLRDYHLRHSTDESVPTGRHMLLAELAESRMNIPKQMELLHLHKFMDTVAYVFAFIKEQNNNFPQDAVTRTSYPCIFSPHLITNSCPT